MRFRMRSVVLVRYEYYSVSYVNISTYTEYRGLAVLTQPGGTPSACSPPCHPDTTRSNPFRLLETLHETSFE